MKSLLFVRTRPLTSNSSSTIRAVSTIMALINCGFIVTVMTTDIEGCNMPSSLEGLTGIKRVIYVPMDKIYTTMRDATDSSRNHRKKQKVIIVAKKIYREFSIIDPLKTAKQKLHRVRGMLENFYDVIVSCSDPKSSHLLALEAMSQGVKCGRFVEIWGDPLAQDISRNCLIPKCFVRNKEKSLLHKADIVLYVSPLTLEEQKLCYPSVANKMELLLPAYLHERKTAPIRDVHLVGYFGDYHSTIRNLMPFYVAVQNKKIKAVICGNSDIELKTTSNTQVLQRQSYEISSGFEDQTDLLICLCNRSGKQIPGKLYQYSATNKPILVILDGEAKVKEYFEKYRRFEFCNNTVDSISKSLDKILKTDYSQLEPIQDFSCQSQINLLRRYTNYSN